MKAFADKGSKVVLRKADNTEGVRSADSTIDGVVWEVKTNYEPTVSAIDNALRKCNGQSKNLVLNVTSDIPDEMLLEGFKGRIHRTNLEQITVERHGEIKRTYSREEILNG